MSVGNHFVTHGTTECCLTRSAKKGLSEVLQPQLSFIKRVASGLGGFEGYALWDPKIGGILCGNIICHTHSN